MLISQKRKPPVVEEGPHFLNRSAGDRTVATPLNLKKCNILNLRLQKEAME